MRKHLRWLLPAVLLGILIGWYAFQRPGPEDRSSGVRARDCGYTPQFGIEVRCSWVEVRDGGPSFTFSVAVLRKRGAAAAADPLVYIPGGPGEGGNTAPPMLSVWEEWFFRTQPGRDFVLVDLRGLTPGFPNWDCTAYTRVTRELLQQNLTFAQESERSAAVFAQCLAEWQQSLATQGGPVADLTRFSSLTNAADLAQVLTRLGYGEWNYLGVSYGTRVALVAALTQPQVRRIILDSPYPLDRGAISDMGELWAQAFAEFWQECESANCPFNQADFERLLRQLREQPRPVVVEDWDSGEKVGWLLNGSRLAAVVYSAFYSSELRHQVAPALRHWLDGDMQALQPLLEVFYNQVFDPAFNNAVFWATECNDNPLQSETAFQESLERLGPWREYFAEDWNYHPCRLPQFLPGQLPPMENVSVPVLVAVGSLDPVTTRTHARALMPRLPRGRLLELPGRSHAEFHSGACGAELIAWFLREDTVRIETQWEERSRRCRAAN